MAATTLPTKQKNAPRTWAQQKATQHRNRLVQRIAVTIATVFIVGLFIFPIYWWIGASFKPYPLIFQLPPHLTFEQTTLAWWEVVIGGGDYGQIIREQVGSRAPTGGGGTSGYYVVPFIVNSLIIGLTSTALVVLVGSLTAYALSRFRTRSHNNLMFFIISTRFMPPVAVALPLYLMYFWLDQNTPINWLDTHHGVIIAHTVINLPLAILLMKSFFDEVPTELDDAALVDGTSRWGSFWRIILPLTTPGIVAAGVLSLIFSWNEFLLTLYLTRSQIRTIPVAMSTFDSSSGGTEWGFLAAAGSAAMIPVFIFILLVQRHLVRGLTLGAVKG